MDVVAVTGLAGRVGQEVPAGHRKGGVVLVTRLGHRLGVLILGDLLGLRLRLCLGFGLLLR